LKLAPTKKITKYVFNNSEKESTVVKSDFLIPSDKIFTLDEFDCDFIGITTDGFETFSEKGVDLKPLEEMIYKYILNTNFLGEFVHRAYKYQLKTNPLISHYDDFTIVYTT
jgi:hypothetical protein